MFQLINRPWTEPAGSRQKILLPVARHTLAKRRWQGAALDGRDFGFDLETHLHDGDIIFATDAAQYVLAQKPEPILEISADEPEQAARIAWSLGNLHFPVEIRRGTIRVADDPAVRLYLERDRIIFAALSDVFHPLKAVSSGHSHGH
jgi:urease accessory protein